MPWHVSDPSLLILLSARSSGNVAEIDYVICDILQGKEMPGGFGGPLGFGANNRGYLGTDPNNRGDLGTAPLYFIGGVILLAGLAFIFMFQMADIGLIISGIGVILIGVQEEPKLSLKWLRYTGPPGLILVIGGLLILMHII
jgi:hypothetical protein